MRRLLFMVWAWLCFCKAQSKAVFAHFMVGNVAFYGVEDWQIDISAAASLGIDAFALNIAYGDDTVSASLSNAFQAVAGLNTDFKLFFSFDYAGGGPWPSADVDSYLGEYTGNAGYYHTDGGQPFVSTFEGPANAQDWVALKANHNVFFMPDWSSLGAGPAWALGVADGLFSWAAWPWGSQDSNTWVDASYLQVLKDGGDTGFPYMMGVSPMFYTNLPVYDKNWAWRGDRLWFDRWKEVLFLQPDYVEIITWNDWGESHYIAPVDPTQSDSVLSLGQAPFDYVSAYSHDGWRYLLPVFTSLYKTGKASLPSQIITAWGRSTSNNAACSVNGTTVNTASQLQLEFPPNQALSDYVFFVVFASDEVDPEVKVTIGGTSVVGAWSDYIEAGEATIYFGNASFSGLTGDVHITATNYGLDILTATGVISGDCSDTDGYMNFNMWTTYEIEENVANPTATMSIEDFVCTAGTSIEEFSDLCEYTCALGYCPYTACLCSSIGPQPDLPTPVATHCYPLANASVVYAGLCSFACTYGYFDTDHCGTAEVAAPIPTVSPFTPDAATGGTGNGDDPAFDDLCEFTCQYGYCPLAACVVTDVGDLVLFTGDVTTAKANFTAEPWNEFLNDLCTFSCNRGHCPDSCLSNLGCTSGTGDGNYAGLCDFSCGYGFCPDPCTCLSNGTRSTPPTFDATIVGYADTGLDADTYGPLCNFTCSHGYCPTPNACLSSITINPDDEGTIPTLPTYDFIVENVTYSPGDFFTYVSDENPNLSLDVILVESTDITTMSCDDVASGDNGATLGCVGEAVEFLMLSILNDQYALSAQKRDVERRTNYEFVTHSQWKASGNCTTTHCMLAEGVPLHTWTSVGNGSYNGAPHELHFINTGKNHGFSARRGLSSNTTMATDIGRRGIPLPQNRITAQILFNPVKLEPLINMDTAEFGNFDKPLIDITAIGAMDSANKGFTITCQAWKDNSTAIASNSDNSDIAEGVMDVTFPIVGTAVGLSSAAIDNYVSTCANEEAAPRTYVVYPRSGTDIDTLSELLASFPNANLEPHVALNPEWGMLYWLASLTPSQWKQVTQNKQCGQATPKCTDDCEDPTSLFVNTDPRPMAGPVKDIDSIHLNATLAERDGGLTSQSNAPADLWFISNPPGGVPAIVPGTYNFDSTAGKNVIVYILDPGNFDMTLPEFSAFAGVVPRVYGGTPDYGNEHTTHGTSMLAALAGATLGVAKSVTVVPITFNTAVGKQIFHDALDYVLVDWKLKRQTLDADLAPFGVLCMSFGFKADSFEWDPTDFFEYLFSSVLKELGGLNLIQLTAAGNGDSIVQEIPALFADPDRLTYVEELAVVGSVAANSGLRSSFSDLASFVNIYAPGENIQTPFWDTPLMQGFLYESGTSHANAKAAGLAAYLIGLSSKKGTYTSAEAIFNDIKSMSWVRGVGGPAAIYNGASS